MIAYKLVNNKKFHFCSLEAVEIEKIVCGTIHHLDGTTEGACYFKQGKAFEESSEYEQDECLVMWLNDLDYAIGQRRRCLKAQINRLNSFKEYLEEQLEREALEEELEIASK